MILHILDCKGTSDTEHDVPLCRSNEDIGGLSHEGVHDDDPSTALHGFLAVLLRLSRTLTGAITSHYSRVVR